MQMETGRAKGEGSELGFPYWVAACRRMEPHDPFFAPGNIERELLAKHIALDLTEDERSQLQSMEDVESKIVFCPIVGCRAQLKYLEDFEDHYHARHTASCSVCSRVYPTSRLLSIHVSEAHDSFFQAKVARGFPMYECLVEGCGVKLKSYQSRQQHLVNKHRFPTSFEFFKKSRLSKQQRQKHQRKQAGYHREGMRDREMEVEEEKHSKKNHRKFQQPKQAEYYKREEMEVEEKKNSMQNHSKFQQPTQAESCKGGEMEEMEMEERMDDLVSAVSKLNTSETTPSSISFGHRHSRGFSSFSPRSVRRNQKQFDPADAKE